MGWMRAGGSYSRYVVRGFRSSGGRSPPRDAFRVFCQLRSAARVSVSFRRDMSNERLGLNVPTGREYFDRRGWRWGGPSARGASRRASHHALLVSRMVEIRAWVEVSSPIVESRSCLGECVKKSSGPCGTDGVSSGWEQMQRCRMATGVRPLGSGDKSVARRRRLGIYLGQGSPEASPATHGTFPSPSWS